MYRSQGSLTIIDAPPHYEPESHGNINSYLTDFSSAVDRGIHAKRPRVIVQDVIDVRATFDLVFDLGTYKCILHRKARRHHGAFEKPANKILDSYLRMTEPAGVLHFMFFDPLWNHGYSHLHEIALSRGLTVSVEKDLSYRFVLRDIDTERVRRYGKQLPEDAEATTRFGLTKKGTVVFSGLDGFDLMTLRR